MNKDALEIYYWRARYGGMLAATRTALKAGASQEVMDVLLQMIEDQEQKISELEQKKEAKE